MSNKRIIQDVFCNSFRISLLFLMIKKYENIPKEKIVHFEGTNIMIKYFSQGHIFEISSLSLFFKMR